ncbi:MAG: hypothetical protein MO852_07435 [Candidatus Devosia euplotis]|nr:hypothetical protein [Candidatus Devosia euplotis]
MNIIEKATLLGALLSVLATPAAAHSLQELDAQLSGREKYFQPAPEFTLVDAAGR